MSYVVLGLDSDHRALVIGSPTGRPFGQESRANRAKALLEASRPRYDWIVLPLNALSDAVHLRKAIEEELRS